MKLTHEPLVIGNWKMYPQTSDGAKRLAQELKKALSRTDSVEVVVAPPTAFLSIVHGVRNSNKVFKIGAQNVHHEPLGAFTGEISIPMEKSFDVSYVIIGHSERRRAGESDGEVNAKLSAVVKAGLTGVVCVGETKRDHSAEYLTHIERQIQDAVKGLSRAKLEHLVIAYEPVWAIGTGHTATPEDVHEMKLFIMKTLSGLYGRNYAEKVRVLYGGSVNPKNAGDIMKGGMVDGFLVGGASLHADEFSGIVKAVKKVCEA
jgi:triosephosphate isomerase